MPRYTVGDKKYRIPGEKAAEFEETFPNAKVEIYDSEGTRYRIPLGKQQQFKDSHEGWNYDGPSLVGRVTGSVDRIAGRALGKDDGETWGDWAARGVERAQRAHDRQQQEELEGAVDLAALTEQTQVMRDYYSTSQGALGRGQTAQGGLVATPEGLKREHLTPTGNRYMDKSMADMESFRYRQAADMTIGGQLRKE